MTGSGLEEIKSLFHKVAILKIYKNGYTKVNFFKPTIIIKDF